MLAQIRHLQPTQCTSLRHQTQIATTKATSPYATTSSTNALDPPAPDHTPHPRRSNPHSERRTPNVTLPAVSSLGGFRTPAAGVRGTARARPASENLHTCGPPFKRRGELVGVTL